MGKVSFFFLNQVPDLRKEEKKKASTGTKKDKIRTLL